MSDITVISRTQRIVVDPVASIIAIVNAGPPGPSTTKSGTGSPEGVLAAPIGTLYVNLSGGTSTTLYVKTSGTGNTGWTAK